MLGNKFAALCGDHDPVIAKLILYRILDDGYGEYFDDIFSKEDTLHPAFYKAIGSATPAIHSQDCEEKAFKFVQDEHLNVSNWRNTWKKVALCDSLLQKLSPLPPSSIGAEFTNLPSIEQRLAVKFLIWDLIKCPGAELKIFSAEELVSPLYQMLTHQRSWRDVLPISKKTLKSVKDFLVKEGFCSRTLTGVTFGWPTAHAGEWHLYGNLMKFNLLRTPFAEIPALFGSACFEAPETSLKDLYCNTCLCLVSARDDVNNVPFALGNAFMSCVDTTDVVAVKWIGTLPTIFGEWSTVQDAVIKTYRQMVTESQKSNN